MKINEEVFILQEDFIIPAGTVFDKIPAGMRRDFASPHFEALIATSNDTTMSLVVTEDELVCTTLFKKG